ncbi:MAG: Gfo/Idh/MocA family oxidoreductase [Planctomycetota bacterium]|nr:Gfo/Idh/MocA family oxidoreductase [Planctomycetota bacterium]
MRDGLTRRGFLGGAAAAAIAGAAGPLIFTSKTRGALWSAGGRAGAQVGLGFIGVGLMNRIHLQSFVKNPRVRVVGVCEVDTTRREHAKGLVDKAYSNSDCVATDDYRTLLARRDIDAVVIATPDHWHAIHAIDACAAGKDVYCEKPLCLTLRECKAMIDAVRTHGRVFQTGSQQRTEYDGKFRTACEYVRSGRLGRILSVNVGVGTSSRWCDLPAETPPEGLDWDRWLGPAPVRAYNAILSPRGIHDHFPRWRWFREYSGGIMTDWGAHHFDIAAWGLDMDVSGPLAVKPPARQGDEYGAELIYPGGVRVIHGGPSGVTFVGEQGVIFVTRERLESIPGDILKKPLEDGDVHLPRAKGHHENWLDCIASRQRPICDVEVGARSIAAAHLLNTAYWYGESSEWCPVGWRFLSERQNAWLDYERRKGFELPRA